MATVTLVEVQPRQASDAAVVTVRLAGGGTRAYTQRGQSDWLSGVARPPRFSSALGFDQRGFTGGALPQTGAVRFAPSRGEVKTALGGLVWERARIVVRVGDDQNPFEEYPVKFIGTVASHSFDRGALALTVADLSADLAKPVLSGTFAGTGGLEGDEEATGRAKRRSWGSVFNVEGFILDKANLVYEFGDPARKLTGFPLVKDKGDAYDPIVAVAWQGSADATLAALRATAVPEGGVAVAPSISCVKPWTRPAGPITADLIAQVVPNSNNSPAWIAASIVREFSATISLPNENEAAAWQPGDAGIHAAEPNETAASILDRLLFPVSIAWVLLGNGQLYFRRLRWDVPVFELNAETVEREVVYPPLRTRRLGFQLNNRIHSDGEISATLLASVDPTYADGTPIDVLRPAEAGANVTENRSSAGFYGQGALATLNQLTNGGPYLSGFGGLSFADIVKLGSTVADSSGAILTNGQVITSQGTAAAIFGQGLLATLNQLANGSQYLSGFGALSALPSIAFGSNYLLEQPGGVAASLSAFKTVLGTAAGFTGQGQLATQNSVTYSTQIGGLPRAIAPSAFFPSGFMYASEIFQDQGIKNLNGYFPEDVNSNRTENRTASAITGQGPLATRSSVNYGSTEIAGLPSALVPSNFLGNGAYLVASSVISNDGVRSLNEYMPATVGADKTANATAAAFTGQTQFATLPAGTSLDNGVFGMPSRLASYSGFLSADQMTYVGGSATVSVASLRPGEANANVTEGRTSAAIYGQGSFATKSSAAYGSEITGLPYAIQPANMEGGQIIDAANVAYAGVDRVAALRPAEAGSNITETRTASAIVGQQYLATNYPARLYGSPQHGDGYLAASAMAFAGGNTVEGLRPGEAGANVTEARQAASIYGQSVFATASNIARDNIFSAGFFNLNAFSLGYSVTRSDGTTTVTESLVVTQVGIAAGFYAQGGLATRNDVDTPQIVENAATNTVAVSAGSLNVPAGGEANGVSAAISAIGRPIAVFFTCDSAVGAQFTATGIFQLRRVQNGEDVQVGRNFTMTRTSPGPLNFLHYVNTPAAGSVTYYVRYVHTGGTGNILVSNQYLTLIETKR